MVHMKLFIQNMVSLRCKLLVRAEIENVGLHALTVELGEVEIVDTDDEVKLQNLARVLHRSGLELMEDKKAILIERIKSVIIELVHYSEELPKVNFSDYLSEKLNMNYNYLSNLFSEVKGTTIEHYIIANKIERAKELLIYDELSLTEIAFRLRYSSVAHLSYQFKKVTGLTPSFFKKMKSKRLTALEDL